MLIHFRRKGILTKNDLNLKLTSFFKNFVVTVSATKTYEILRMPMTIQKAEVNLLKSEHYY